jgi:glycosyltransferase involved in cell wall biosynthesis
MNARGEVAATAERRERRGAVSHLGSLPTGEFGIHQILAAASPGDAITNAALDYRDVLRRVGPSEVFARHIAPSSAGEVRPLSEFGSSGSRGLLVYHASIGEPTVSAFLLSRSEPIVLVYHNITPARYFEGIDDTFAELLVLGRLELESIRHRVVLAVAASRFNAAELEAIGYEDVRVIPPVVKPFRLVRTEPDPEMLNLLDREFDAPLLLFVGQLLPHKRPDLLVKAMHVAATYLGTQAVLLLVGQNRFARYADAVSAQVRELNLPQVHVIGSIDDARLAAMFRRATAFDVPVVARACAAIPETVGDAGLLLPAWAGAELVAGAMDRIVSDSDLRDELIARGRRRLQELTEIDASVTMLEAIGEIV